jgi:hypothetical protein
MSELSELKVLQAMRLKGRVDEATVVATVDEDPATAATTIADLTEAGLVLAAGRTLKISTDGRARLEELLARERSGIDTAPVAAAYDDFRGVNADFKALVFDWQSKDGEPNTHEDADYDAAVRARLDGVHQHVMPIITAAAAQIPRLAAYSDKLAAALAKIRAGETMWFTRPIIDSYHTVWFELHEELIQAVGLTREDEAKAGHGQ